MRSLNLSSTHPRRGLLPAVVLALFLVLAQRPGPAAALGETPPGLPPQVLAVAGDHNCALSANGAVECWGSSSDGKANPRTGPYTQVSAGDNHTCALTPAGAADCWGSNSDGQADPQAGPYTQVSAGGNHTCALTPAGAADCWGRNSDGQAGDQPGPYVQISTGYSHTCALTVSGAADCWGFNIDFRADDQPGPYTWISAGNGHTCALTPAGAADCWGSNSGYGEADDKPGPYTMVSVGVGHTCALTPAGAVDCWGYGLDGRSTDQPGPYTWVGAGYSHNCALTPTGAADCWGGDNDDGEATDQPGPYRPYEPNEPNDSAGFDAMLGYEETIRNNFIGVAGDVDYYYVSGFPGQRFIVEVEAAAIGSDLDSVLTLYDTDGTTVLAENDDANGLDSRLDFTFSTTGSYFLRVRDFNNPNEGGPGYYYNLNIHPFSLNASGTKPGTVGGVETTAQDIVRYDYNFNAWSMLLDGSDVGITKPLTAFARLPGGDWLLVFKANQPTPAGTFTPWDIARFTPASLGNTTAGTFSWYFDGSDVGLTSSGEKIDALDWSTGVLLLSTGGTASVTGPGGTIKAQDEDMLQFAPTTTGANTAGEWATFFDGTAIPGMKGEDLAGAHYDSATGEIYVSIIGGFKIGGVSGSDKDILRLTPDGGAPGGYSVALGWHGPDTGFNLKLNGFEMD